MPAAAPPAVGIGAPGRTLSRAALVFATAAAATGCGPEASGPVAVYGPPPVQVEAGTTVTVTPPSDPTGPVKPPPPTTTSDAGANAPPPEPPPPPGPERDAGSTLVNPPRKQPEIPHPQPVPLYGVPPMRGRH